jgi:hypothetical protein
MIRIKRRRDFCWLCNIVLKISSTDKGCTDFSSKEDGSIIRLCGIICELEAVPIGSSVEMSELDGKVLDDSESLRVAVVVSDALSQSAGTL